ERNRRKQRKQRVSGPLDGRKASTCHGVTALHGTPHRLLLCYLRPMREFVCLAILLALNLNAASNRRELPDLGQTWLNTVAVNGSGTLNSGQAVAADAEGHFYVGGHFKDPARFGTNVFTSRHSFDAYLAKYDLERNFIWVIRVENAAAYACTV